MPPRMCSPGSSSARDRWILTQTSMSRLMSCSSASTPMKTPASRLSPSQMASEPGATALTHRSRFAGAAHGSSAAGCEAGGAQRSTAEEGRAVRRRRRAMCFRPRELPQRFRAEHHGCDGHAGGSRLPPRSERRERLAERRDRLGAPQGGAMARERHRHAQHAIRGWHCSRAGRRAGAALRAAHGASAAGKCEGRRTARQSGLWAQQRRHRRTLLLAI